LDEFLPRYSIAERVAAYSIVGGIPAYLQQFNDAKSLGANVRHLLLRRSSLFHSEPFFLIGDVIRRETQTYEGVLKAIASGQRTPRAIGLALGVTSSYLSPYLKQLEALHLIDRRIPATIPREQRRTSRSSRYHLSDPYLRFYFRFLATNLELVEQDLSGMLWERISTQFRAYVGLTAFEELCREWTLAQARANKLPFPTEIVGSHWSKNAQVDVVALNWQDKAILLGECKWSTHAVGRSVVRELADKAPIVVPDKDWQTHYVLFSRAGFTDRAQEEARSVGAQLIDLNRLDSDLREALSGPR
jgi:AAA+ ATPase superfamily predicted ATPase